MMRRMYTESWGGGPSFGGNPFSGHVTPLVKNLLLANIIVFLLQIVIGAQLITSVFGLPAHNFFPNGLWGVFTYMFLHAGILHLLMNMLVLFFLGPETERAMGPVRFLRLYLLSGVLGGLGWVLLTDVGYCVGASGAIYGIIGAFAALFPHRPITLLLFFVLPITMPAWVLAVGLGVIELFVLISHESQGGVANAAHLAGGIAGYMYALALLRPTALYRLMRWRPGRKPRLTVVQGGRKEEPSPREVDRILDKIAREGMSSLTRQEREILENVSRNRAFFR